MTNLWLEFAAWFPASRGNLDLEGNIANCGCTLITDECILEVIVSCCIRDITLGAIHASGSE